MGVLRPHRVERPGDEAQAAAERLLPLRPLQAWPDAEAAGRGAHGQHVRVQVGLAAPQRREGVAEPDGLSGALGDEEETPRVHGGDELDGRGDLEVREAPDLALQPHAGFVVAPRGPAGRGRPCPRSLASRAGARIPRPAMRETRKRREGNGRKAVARARRGRGAGPGFFARLRRAAGLLLSREVAVLMNAIAFNVLLCLFPILLVLVAVPTGPPAAGPRRSWASSSPSSSPSAARRSRPPCGR